MGFDDENTASDFDDTESGKGYWIFALIIYCLGTLIMVIITIYHFRAWYLDFFTTDRKSVEHRREAPPKTFYYNVISYLTNGTVLLYLLAMITGIWGNFTSTQGSCFAANIVFLISFQIAKAQTYCVFLMRLHRLYRLTVYGYNWKWLLAIASMTIIISLVIIIGEIEGTVASIISYTFSNQIYFCDGTIPIWVIILIGLLDVCLSIGFLVAFSYSLKKAVNDYVEQNKLSTYLSDRTTSKIIFQGMKYKILTMVSIISTLIAIIIGGVTDTGKTELNSIDINDALRLIIIPDNAKEQTEIAQKVQKQIEIAASGDSTDNQNDKQEEHNQEENNQSKTDDNHSNLEPNSNL
eukprot:163642_1